MLEYGEIIAAAWGAIVGALGAFAAAQIHFVLSTRHDRWEEHRDSLVRLELILNEFLDMAHVNIKVLTKFQTTVDETDNKKMFWGTPSQLPLDRKLLPNLMNIGLTNELFSLIVKTRRINHDIETAFESYNLIKQAFIKNEISFDQYKTTTSQLIEWSNVSVNAHKLLIDMDKKLIAIVKLLLRRDKPHKITSFIVKKYSFKFTDDDICAIQKELEIEIKSIEKESIKKADEYLGLDSTSSME